MGGVTKLMIEGKYLHLSIRPAFRNISVADKDSLLLFVRGRIAGGKAVVE